MKKFVILEEIEQFSEVIYYSTKIYTNEEETPKYNEFEKFILKFQDHEDENIREEYQDIYTLIEFIGDDAAKLKYFRPENAAFALPSPRGTNIKGIEIKVDSKLRLYCVLINENIVILCNGDWKTTNKTQNCPNVASHFRFAEKLAKYLQKNINDIKEDEWTLNIGESNGFYL